ncbi:uncharacterized protein LOC128553454 [Mercenaria mercenaria]|uniref:uncharacterized protein LOC128553454 n=1 Tax=Mercenaria mercenaria TaxID=6596 RepID=UPI00234F40CF|nr:uncharacterized protein LOC128553454 [Mercenaria mercenaria]
MAVSGRKLSDFQSSVSKGSEEDFNQECDPCFSDGQHEDAHGYCVDCKEYLCKRCLEFHQRTNAFNHHQLLDKDNMGFYETASTTTSQVCTEKCTKHTDEVIKFFCPEHKALGCHDCMIMDHRTCKIDYIPGNCAGVEDSEEYKGTMWLLNQKLKEIDFIMKKATIRDKKIDVCYDNLFKQIVKFRKEINDHLDQLQRQLKKEADRKKSDGKQVIKTVLQTFTNVSADFNKLQSNLSFNNQSKQNGQLYINIKQAQAKLKSDEIKKAEEALEKTNMQYSFERNKKLEGVLSKPNILGNLTLSSTLAMPRKKVNYIKKSDINVRTKSDPRIYKYRITGCAVLSSNKLVLADDNQRKLKVVDIQSKAVIEEKTLGSYPWDIAKMPRDHIAVTLPENSEVIIMKAASNLSIVHKIPVKCKCYGIFYHQDHLYVVCQNPNSALILDTQGNVQNTISLYNDIFNDPQYIVVSEDSRRIYISDYDSHCIVSITLQGDVSAVYKHVKLSTPLGMVMLDDGSFLVCSFWNDTILHISGDLKKGQTMIGGISYPQSICYSHQHDAVYIGCWDDLLKSYSLK